MREIDLTRALPITYSLRSMDSNEQPPKGEAFNGVPKREGRADPGRVEASKKMWEESNKRRISEGKIITQDEREAQRVLIEMGLPPIGGASPEVDEPGGLNSEEVLKGVERIINSGNSGLEESRGRLTRKDIAMLAMKEKVFQKYGIVEDARERLDEAFNDDEKADRLFQRFRDEGIEKDPEKKAEILVEEYAEETGIDPNTLRKAFEEFYKRQDEIYAEVERSRPYKPEVARGGSGSNIPPEDPPSRFSRDRDDDDDEREYDDGPERPLDPADVNARRLKTSKDREQEAARHFNEELMKTRLNRQERENVEELRRQGLATEQELTEIIKKHIWARSPEGREAAVNGFIKKLSGRIDGHEDIDELKKDVDISILQAYGDDIKRFNEDKYEEYTERWSQLQKINNLDELKDHATKFVADVADFLHGFSATERATRVEVNNVKDLFQLIMDSEGSTYRTGGEFELIDKEGNLHEEHFMAWIRSRIEYLDDQSPFGQINPMNEIAIETPYKNVTFSTMYGTPKYFMKEEMIPIKGPDGKPIFDLKTGQLKYETRLVPDENLQRLKNRALYEVWPFGENHNNFALYVAAMGQAKQLQESLPKAHYNNLYTQDRLRFLGFLKIAGIEDIATDKADALDGQKFQGSLGKAHQRALVAYKFLPDREQFRKVFNRGVNTEENSPALLAYYQSVVEQVFEDKLKFLIDFKKEQFKKANYGKPAGEFDITLDLFGEDRLAFWELLNLDVGEVKFENEKDLADVRKLLSADTSQNEKQSIRNSLNRGDGGTLRNIFKANQKMTWEYFLSLTNDPESFAINALNFKYSNTAVAGDPNDPEKERSRGKLLKELGMPKKNSEDVYEIFNIYRLVKNEYPQVTIVRNAIKKALIKTNEIDRNERLAKYRAEAAKITETDEVKRGKLIAGLSAKYRIQDFDESDENYNVKQRRLMMMQKQDTSLGELWAFRETYWMGISADLDTNATAFDKWSNEVNLSSYLMNQGDGRGGFGMEDRTWGIKRLALTFLYGMRVKKEGSAVFDTPLIEILQGGQGNDVDVDKEIENFDFEGNAQRQWLVDNVLPSFKMAEFLIDKWGLDLDKFFTHDYRGRMIIDKEKAKEHLQDFLYHDLRYIYDNAGINWDRKIRTWWHEYDANGERHKVWGEQTLRDYMFDPEVQEMDMYHAHDLLEPVLDEHGNPVKDENGKVRMIDPRFGSRGQGAAMARNVFAFLIMKELSYHMRDSRGSLKWGLHQVQAAREYFETWGYKPRPVDKKGNPVYIKKDENGNNIVDKHGKPVYEAVDKNGRTYISARDHLEHAQPFFSEEEYESITDPAGANEKQLKNKIFLHLLWMFFIGSVWGTVREAPKALK